MRVESTLTPQATYRVWTKWLWRMPYIAGVGIAAGAIVSYSAPIFDHFAISIRVSHHELKELLKAELVA
jgi:hypothetical protein